MMAVFKQQTEPKKAIHLTFITTYGLNVDIYSGEVQSQVTMDGLFL